MIKNKKTYKLIATLRRAYHGDGGVGIPQAAEKLNHYGLAIMQERSKHLGGRISIKRRPEGGTGVYFSFTPECLLQQQMA
ncbi:hypothetical protein [Alishewanella longhuensis]